MYGCMAINRITIYGFGRMEVFNVYKAGIITVSDKGYAGERTDTSGLKIRELLPVDTFEVVSYKIVPDEIEQIRTELIRLCDVEHCHVVFTTGGTGFAVRDVTPEATVQVADRHAPGIAEAIRSYSLTITKRAMLSRGVSVIRGSTLIINLPGSTKAVEESLSYIADTIAHGLGVLLGAEKECGHNAKT